MKPEPAYRQTTDASEAIELLQSTQYGAVVLDDELPSFGSLRV
ncbi:MAG: hypothetical protein WKH64_10225 [Chloroflexia bacterium]